MLFRRRHERRGEPRHRHRRRHRRDDGQQRLQQRPDPQVQRHRLGLRRRRSPAAAAGVTSITAGTGLTGGNHHHHRHPRRRHRLSAAARHRAPAPPGSSIRTINADGTVTCETDDIGAGPANAFVQGGNAFGATAVLGTTDNNAVDIRVNNSRVMRYEPNATSPNVIAGHPANSVIANVYGATIAGGGTLLGGIADSNTVKDHFGTVGGGVGNVAGGGLSVPDDATHATVGGGWLNTANGNYAAVGGGWSNTASLDYATVGGGYNNLASAVGAAIAGGSRNTASDDHAAVGGGHNNAASATYSAIGGGFFNVASGEFSTVPGGQNNEAQGAYSLAAGRRAKALAIGAFTFGDSTDADVSGNVANALVMAFSGGIGLYTNKRRRPAARSAPPAT